MTTSTPEQAGLTRRDILKRGAAFGGALMWATPVVQVMGMSSAHARPVSPGCTRYCIKWETDGNQWILDTETGDQQLTCDDLVVWTSFWVGLGGPNADEVDSTEEAAALSATADQADEPTTTSSTTTTTEALNGTAEEEEEEEEEDGEELDDEGETEVEEIAEEDTEGGEGSETEGALSGSTDESESSTELGTSSSNEVTPSQNNGRNGPPEGNPGGPPEGNPGGPPEGHPGNCIECDTSSSVNSDAAAQQVAEDMGIEVYGDPITGFYVSIPSNCSLADLDEEGLDSAAVKVGGPGGGECSVVVSEEDDPCRDGYTRIILPNPDMARDISHIELIIDCCD